MKINFVFNLKILNDRNRPTLENKAVCFSPPVLFKTNIGAFFLMFHFPKCLFFLPATLQHLVPGSVVV